MVSLIHGSNADHPNHEELLILLFKYRFATTTQLARFTKKGYVSIRSATRQTLRHLATLEKHGQVIRLERRVGGWQGGSAVSTWALTTRGFRHLTGRSDRQRPKDLSTTFLAHTLAVTEFALITTETAQRLEDTTTIVTTEPNCWRQYLTAHGQTTWLRPDAHLIVLGPKFADTYFVEIDRDTENPARVISRCHAYQTYRRTGLEQKENEVFPAVIWVVPHESRAEKLRSRIHAEPGLARGLFHVITPEEVPALIEHGPPTL